MELKAVVPGPLLEVRSEALTLEWTLQDGEVQKPVRGGARTGEATLKSVVSAAVSRRSTAKGHEVQRASRRGRCAMMVITEPLTGGTAVAIVVGAGDGSAVMACSEVEHEGRHRQR